MQPAQFEIHESPEPEWLRLKLLGELDLSSASLLTTRLGQLRDQRQPVLMDLSQLEFMDSTGLHILIDSIRVASSEDWRLSVDPNLAPEVERLFRLDKRRSVRRHGGPRREACVATSGRAIAGRGRS